LVRALCLQAPPQLHIALSGRRLPRLGLGAAAGSGELLEIAAPDLAFTPQETAHLVSARLGEGNDSVATQCWELTSGWAAALHLIVDRLERLEPGEWQPTLNRLPLISGQLWDEFVADLLLQESPQSRQIIELAAVAPIVDAELLAALGVRRPASELESLQRRGLLVAPGGHDRRTMSPVLSAVVCEQLPAAEVTALREQAGAWLESVDRLDEALECRRAGPPLDSRTFLERRGHALVARGAGAGVAEILGQIGTGDGPALDGILAEALQAVGDWDGAMETFGRLRQTMDGGKLAPELAWRYGALLYLRGESATALEVLSAAHVASSHSSDDALVSAWLSSTQWSRGEPEEADADGCCGAPTGRARARPRGPRRGARRRRSGRRE
jgi:tetratricopeptide (TPR) repeat protein